MLKKEALEELKQGLPLRIYSGGSKREKSPRVVT